MHLPSGAGLQLRARSPWSFLSVGYFGYAHRLPDGQGL
jgi:hypothetical protein